MIFDNFPKQINLTVLSNKANSILLNIHKKYLSEIALNLEKYLELEKYFLKCGIILP